MDYKKFIVFVVVLIAALSIGMTAYYFLRDNETIVIKNVEVYVNVGDTFNVEVERHDPKAQTSISFSIANTEVVFQESTGEFKAKGAGTTEITLITNKQRIETQKCIVHVGDGSEGNPYFIDDADDLTKIGDKYPLNKNFKMIADIDLSSVENFTPIAKDSSFTGTFDGNGYKISNLTTTATEVMQYAGLFEKVGASGVVKDLTVVNANISGNILVAGVIAAVNNGTIQCTKVESANLSSTADEAKLGGIAGLNKTTDGLAKLDRVASNAVISSTNKANLGGIACENEKARIINSYFQGRLSSESTQSISAGIVVKNKGEGEDAVAVLKKCYAVAEYTSNAGAKYGVIANNNNAKNKVYGLYFDESVAGEGVIANPEGNVSTFLIGAKTTAQMKEQATYVYYVDDANVSYPWNFEIIWSMQEGQTYPALVMRGNESDIDPEVDGSLILTAQDLKDMNMAGAYKLGADIDLAGETNWAGIGTEGAPFQGVLDGNGHKIKNLKSNLFGYIGSNATIKNLGIEGVNISKNGTVGALAVRNYGYVENISVSAKDEMNRLQVTPTGDVSVGAIVGINNGTIMGAQSNNINITVNENSETGYVGGIVGTNEGYIYNANSESFISVNTAKAVAGGIVGHNSKYINNSKFKGTLTANTTNEDVYVGGVAGYNVSNATINLSGAKANVTGYNVGGVVGFNNYGTVNKCYVLDGSVLTGNKVGGIVSSLQRGEVNDCYSIANLVGASNGAKKAGFAVYVQGHTDLISGEGECAEMNHCFSACTFDNNGDNYCESYSDVHVSFAGTGHSKEAGYINSSIYDKDKADNAKKSSTSGNWWWGSSEDVGDRSTSSCQSTGTFTGRGFDNTIWSLDSGSYPTLAGVSYDYFN